MNRSSNAPTRTLNYESRNDARPSGRQVLGVFSVIFAVSSAVWLVGMLVRWHWFTIPGEPPTWVIIGVGASTPSALAGVVLGLIAASDPKGSRLAIRSVTANAVLITVALAFVAWRLVLLRR